MTRSLPVGALLFLVAVGVLWCAMSQRAARVWTSADPVELEINGQRFAIPNGYIANLAQTATGRSFSSG